MADEGKQTESTDQAVDQKPTDADANAVQNKKEEPDLDTLLDEYGKQTDSTEKNKQTESTDDDELDLKLTPDEIRELRKERAENFNKKIHADIEASVTIARKAADLPESANPIVEGLLHQAVANNPKMRAAWENRGQNPDQWNKILEKQSEKFVEMIDDLVAHRTGSSNNSALESAVLSSKKSKPSSGNDIPGLGELVAMSDAEFAKYTRG